VLHIRLAAAKFVAVTILHAFPVYEESS